MLSYSCGLHILSEFKTANEASLKNIEECKLFFDSQISIHNLCNVGEVYHQFENGGFTASICLTESHISIHTWPEFCFATFDIYLSNYQKDNHETTRAIHKELLKFFQVISHDSKEILR